MLFGLAMENPFQFSKAVVCCGVASSLPATAIRLEEPGEPIDLERARQQHAAYTEVLRGLVKEVHEIPVDDRYPDCVFVEDPVVACGDTAFLPIAGHENRKGEKVAMKKMMEKLGMKIVEMVEPGCMDGGDVLFTGKEFFVGLSTRTNKSGLSQMAAAFPSYPVTGVEVSAGLHLKSVMSMAGPDLIAIGMSTSARDARKVIEDKGHFKYKFFEVPDNTGANCLYLNNTLIHASKDCFPDSWARFEQLDTPAKKVALASSELNKVDGCFTCCSVLIQ